MSNEIKFEDLKFPDDIVRYSATNEWVCSFRDAVEIGITDYAQAAMRGFMRDEHLQSIFVDGSLKVGDEVEVGDVIGEVHSSKTTSDIYTPLSGTVIGINGTKQHGVYLIPVADVENDPYGKGYLIRIRPNNEADEDELLSAKEYMLQCKDAH